LVIAAIPLTLVNALFGFTVSIVAMSIGDTVLFVAIIVLPLLIGLHAALSLTGKWKAIGWAIVTLSGLGLFSTLSIVIPAYAEGYYDFEDALSGARSLLTGKLE
jgi:hypothetical protein